MSAVSSSAQNPTNPTALQASQVGGAIRVEATGVQPDPANSQPSAETRPEWLPEKFKTGEDLAKAYAELEKKQGATPPSPPTPDPAQPQTPPADPNAAVAAVGVKDFQAYSNEFAEKGELSAESYAALEKKGFSKELVDTYIQGQVALNEGRVNEVYNAVGGQEQYRAMLEWAEEALDQNAIDAYNAVVVRGNQAEILLAVNGLKAQYQATNKTPNLIGGKPPGSGGGEAPFLSTAEMVAAMSDARYKTDSAYRDMVERRLAKSDILS